MLPRYRIRPTLARDPLWAGLVHYYRLEEKGGARYDLVGGKHLTDVNTVGYATDGMWTNCVGVDVGSDGRVTKTAAEGWGNAGCASRLGFSSGDGYVETIAPSGLPNIMCGLSNGDSNQTIADIDFAGYFYAPANFQAYESGVYKAQVGAVEGDVLRVAVEGGSVVFRKNGALFYTSPVAPTYPLNIDTTIYLAGASFLQPTFHADAGLVAVLPGAKRDKAAWFVRANIERLEHATIPNTPGDFTCALWMRTADIADYIGLVSLGGAAEYHAGAIYGQVGTALVFIIGDGSVVRTAAVDGYRDGNWHLIIAYYDSISRIGYISADNGTPVASVSLPGTKSNPTVVNVGRLVTASGTFDGHMSHVGLWNRVLSASERAKLWNNGAGKFL